MTTRATTRPPSGRHAAVGHDAQQPIDPVEPADPTEPDDLPGAGDAGDDTDPSITTDDESGQATTEYALVLLGAALVALLLIGWATAGGGAGKVGHLLDHVLDTITSKL